MDISLGAVLKRRSRSKAGPGAAEVTYHERVVEVPNLIEEVDLIFAREQCRAYAVYGRVTPSLIK